MDLSRCNCDKAGFCPVFRRDMDDKNHHWCKTATESKRVNYIKQNGVSVLETEPEINKRFVTNKDFYEATMKLIPYVSKFDGIVGVPRSGMIPASILSVALNKPLFSICKNQIQMLKFMSSFGGSRMINYKGNQQNLVFIDDTTCNGNTANYIKSEFGANVNVASIFSTSLGSKFINNFSEILELPHILEWNFFNSGYCPVTCFDIDGIFCPDVPIPICQDENKYIDYITNIEPFHERIPKLFKAQKLVTGRLEKYRSITETWLEKHGFNYEELIMFPTEREQERNLNHYEVIGNYKADVYNNSNCEYFVESSLMEAEFISQKSGKIVIQPNDGVVL